MNIGPITPVSKKAMSGMDRISKILANTPQEEWEFVLKQAKDIAIARLGMKALAHLYRKL